jgi:hypothetical protein
MSNTERSVSKQQFADLATLDEHLAWPEEDFVRAAARSGDRRKGLVEAMDLEDSIQGQLDEAIDAAAFLGRLLAEEHADMALPR